MTVAVVAPMVSVAARKDGFTYLEVVLPALNPFFGVAAGGAPKLVRVPNVSGCFDVVIEWPKRGSEWQRTV